MCVQPGSTFKVSETTLRFAFIFRQTDENDRGCTEMVTFAELLRWSYEANMDPQYLTARDSQAVNAILTVI